MMRWACLLWIGMLLWWQPVSTLLLLIPTLVLVPIATSLLMNVTDHVPGEPAHPFLQATYLQPTTLRERIYAARNRQSGATHRTHHLFPQVHWTLLQDVQEELLPICKRHGSPRSLLHTSMLLGN